MLKQIIYCEDGVAFSDFSVENEAVKFLKSENSLIVVSTENFLFAARLLKKTKYSNINLSINGIEIDNDGKFSTYDELSIVDNIISKLL